MLLATYIVLGISAYIAAALHTARHLVGHWAYAKYLSSSRSSYHRNYGNGTADQFELDSWADGDMYFGAIMLSTFLLPAVVITNCFYSRNGQFGIDPKEVRKAKEITQQKEKIAELEKELEQLHA